MPVPIKAALIALSAVPLASATQTNIAPSDNPAIVRVDCAGSRGSAFFVGPHVLLSVAHVTNEKSCNIVGEPIKVIHTRGDFSILYSKRGSGKWLKVDCGGYVAGKKYRAIGFARGLATQTEVGDLEATGYEKQGLQLLDGVFTVIPGQSGGPILNDAGNVSGTVNAYWAAYGLSGSVELRQTAVCRR